MNSNAKLKGSYVVVPENPVSRFLFADSRMGIFWLIVRLYLGYAWLKAGWGKVTSPAWTGENAGAAVTGYLKGAIARGDEGIVPGWYVAFLENVALPNAKIFSFFVAYGELLVGLGLIVGLFTGVAAFFGGFMNVIFLLAGTLSTNPILFILATWLVLAWRNAGWYGLDRWALPYLGTPWKRVEKVEKEVPSQSETEST